MVGLVAFGGLGLGCESEEAEGEPAYYCRGESPAFILDVLEDDGLSGEVSVACHREGTPVEDIYPCRVPGTGTDEFQNRYRTRYFSRATAVDPLRIDIRQGDLYVGRDISVEVRPEEGLARVCLIHYTDQLHDPCGPDEYPTADCAETGALSMTDLTAPGGDFTGMHVAGEVRFADGLEIAFSVPLVDSP